jgi:two-component system sensor histidine kinase MtrB
MIRMFRRHRRLTDPLYDLARLEEAGAVRLRPRRIRIARRVESVVNAVAAEETPQIEINIPSSLKATFDPDVFDRIVANLISNAVRYGSPPYTISSEPTADRVQIVFQDRGRGISPDFEPRLFERFARSEISRSEADGAGLGLALRRLYARAHGGDVVHEQSSEPGARFSVVLPAT